MTYKTEACSKGFSPDFIYHCLPELDIIGIFSLKIKEMGYFKYGL